jgi:uncharacterized protein YciI
MRYVVWYTVVAERATDLPSVYPRHKANLDSFEPPADIIGIGTFEDPVANGSMAIFETIDAARRFVASDPFVVEGLVTPSKPLAWNA